jgi:hypothetical protein
MYSKVADEIKRRRKSNENQYALSIFEVENKIKELLKKYNLE